MDIEKVKKELKEKLRKGSFEFKERGISLIEPQITGFESDLQVVYMNPTSEEYDNYSFSGNAQLKRLLAGNPFTDCKSFSGTAKITEYNKSEIIIEITKTITIR